MNAAPAAHAPSARASIRAYRVRFSGAGAEYFRVWIVNVLLTVATLTLYTPVARLRTARYFYGHTVVADTPLEFSASVRRMFLGFLVFLALYVAVELSSYFGYQAVSGWVSAGVALLLPFFWGSAMRFRLRATRWRGVRLVFGASWGQVYRASWPVLLVLAAWLGLMRMLLYWFPEEGWDEGELETQLWPWVQALSDTWVRVGPVQAAMTLLAVLGLLAMLALAVQDFNYRRLLVRSTRVGQQAGYWRRPRLGVFVRAWLVSALLAAVLLAMVWALMTLVLGLLFGGISPQQMGEAMWGIAALVISLVLAGVGFFLALMPALAYREALVFQTVWNEVGLGKVMRTKCSLSVWGFVALRLKNVLLTLLTLGFYRPFARVSEYRRKVESVTLYVKGGLDQLQGQLSREQGALGDAMADVLGLDII